MSWCICIILSKSLAYTQYLKVVATDVDMQRIFQDSEVQLSSSFMQTMQSIWEHSGGSFNPSDLFGRITRKWKQFKGFRQQDSHELMRFLIDGMKEEQLKVNQCD